MAVASIFRFTAGPTEIMPPAGTVTGSPSSVARHLAGVDEVDLLLARRALVVLGDEHVARVLRDGVDAERA